MKYIGCVGDSITYGAGVPFRRNSRSYPAFLGAKLGDEWKVVNFGISGRTLLSSGDWPYANEKLYTKSLALKAELYIIMLGTNDTKPQNWNAAAYEAELREFVKVYHSVQEKPDIILVQPPKAHEVKGQVGFSINNEIIKAKVCSIIARVGAETGCRVADLYTYTENHPEWFADGVHPNAAGNEKIAEYLAGMCIN